MFQNLWHNLFYSNKVRIWLDGSSNMWGCRSRVALIVSIFDIFKFGYSISVRSWSSLHGKAVLKERHSLESWQKYLLPIFNLFKLHSIFGVLSSSISRPPSFLDYSDIQRGLCYPWRCHSRSSKLPRHDWWLFVGQPSGTATVWTVGWVFGLSKFRINLGSIFRSWTIPEFFCWPLSIDCRGPRAPRKNSSSGPSGCSESNLYV